MKTKEQKQKELEKGQKLLGQSRVLVFADFSQIKTTKLRELRRELKKLNASFFVIKKRLLNLLLKKQKAEIDFEKFKSAIGTIFSATDLENISSPVFKFFSGAGGESKTSREAGSKKILGGYDLKTNQFIEAEKIVFLGQLPPREVLLAQFLGTLAAPIRSLLYVLNEKSKQMVETK